MSGSAPNDVAAFLHRKLREGLAHSTIHHQLNVLQGTFRYAMKRGWARENPVASVERPKAPEVDPDIRYLDTAELEALLQKTPDDILGPTDGVLYLTAAMTGMRQGELCALRWQDVDWIAGVIRVRRNYTRGRWGTPKSRRSSRSVPMADRVGAELERHFQRTPYTADDDLVFCHPQTGNPYDALEATQAFQGRIECGGRADGAFPRPSPYVRDGHGLSRRPATRSARVDGSQGLAHDEHLRGLRARSVAWPDVGRARLRGGYQSGYQNERK